MKFIFDSIVKYISKNKNFDQNLVRIIETSWENKQTKRLYNSEGSTGIL